MEVNRSHKQKKKAGRITCYTQTGTLTCSHSLPVSWCLPTCEMQERRVNVREWWVKKRKEEISEGFRFWGVSSAYVTCTTHPGRGRREGRPPAREPPRPGPSAGEAIVSLRPPEPPRYGASWRREKRNGERRKGVQRECYLQKRTGKMKWRQERRLWEGVTEEKVLRKKQEIQTGAGMQTDKGMTNEWPKKFKSAAINLKKKKKK